MPVAPSRRGTIALCCLSLTLAAACGGGDGPTGSDGGNPPPAVASVDVSAPATSLLVGGTLTLAATPRTAAGAAVSTATVSWSSSNTAVATVSGSGVVTGVAVGSAVIKASSSGREASVELTVRAAGAMTSAGGTIGTTTSTVRLTVPAGALATATTLTVEPTEDPVGNEHLVAGTSYEFGPDGTQFAQPVTLTLKYDPAKLPAGASPASLRIAKYTGDRWTIIDEDASVDAASGTVSASIHSFSSYAVVSDPCGRIGSMGLGATSGQITLDDCLYHVAGRRSDYYSLSAPAGQVITVASSGTLEGLFGLKQETSDPSAGTVWTSTSMGGTLRLVSNGDPVQLFVSGQDSTKAGSYSFTRSNEAVAHSCDTDTYMMPGSSLSQTLNEGNSCVVSIEYPAVPEAKGKPLHAHYFGVKLEAGKSYTITISGLGGGFDPGLTVFAGGKVAGAYPNGQQVTSRSVTVTPTTTRLHVIEVGSGHFADAAFTTWVNPSGSYTLNVSR